MFLHHDCITGTAITQVDDDYFKRIGEIEARLYQLISPDNSSEYSFCDFNEFQTKNIDQCNFHKLLKDNKQVNFILYNPTLLSSPRLFKLVISNTADAHTIQITRDNVTLKTDVICLSQNNFCEIYFKDSIKPLSNGKYVAKLVSENREVTANLIHTDDGVNEESHLNKIKENNSQQKHSPVSIEESGSSFDFEGFTLEVFKDYAIYTSKLDAKKQNVISFSKIRPQASGHYVIDYWGKLNFKNYNTAERAEEIEGENIEGLHIYGSKIEFKIYQEKDKPYYHLETLVKVNDDLNAGNDIILQINQPNINHGDDFYTDSNGLHDMHRKKKTGWEESVYPVASFIRLRGSADNLGLSIFNDRAQGGLAQNRTAHLYIQRSSSTNDGKGNYQILSVNEDVLLHHVIYNYNLDDVSVDQHMQTIHNHFEVEYALLVPNNDQIKLPLASHSNDSCDDFPDNLRIVFDFITGLEIVIRLQNISRDKVLQLNIEKLVRCLKSKGTVSEVDFDYFFSENKEQKIRAVADTNDIKPLEFLVLAIKKNK